MALSALGLAWLLVASSVFLAIGDTGVAQQPPQPAPKYYAPPMGWMAWEIFRCETDCVSHPDGCISADLFKSHADRLADDGYLAAGYDTVHIDDCWMAQSRTADDERTLESDPDRFPLGIAELADYVHSRGVRLGLYTAESERTCAGYPASAGHEELDAGTFAEWGVDYLKVDGCGPPEYYEEGYTKMSRALSSSGRDITYSCSWPAYLGDDETKKDAVYREAVNIGCNLWRNYADIQCHWESLSDIIEHWGEYGAYLAKYAGARRFNDPDMLLVGNTCVTDAEARTQMAIWSVVMAPLIMGNDLRTIPDSHRDILLNREAIAVNQDRLLRQGTRTSGDADTGQVWIRTLSDGHAVALYNPTDDDLSVTVTLGEHSLPDEAQVRCIWRGKDLGPFRGELTKTVGPHDTLFFKLTSTPYASSQ